jgi:hypothetical protein
MAMSNKAVKEKLHLLMNKVEGGAFVVAGMERQVRALRKQSKSIKDLESTHKQGVKELRDAVAKQRAEAEAQGMFFKSCKVLAGEDEAPVVVTWKESYKGVELLHEPFLRETFGANFGAFFCRQASLKAKSGVTVEMLRTALGDEAWEKLQQFADVTEDLRVQGELMKTRAHMRTTASKELNERLDIVVGAKQYDPQVRL